MGTLFFGLLFFSFLPLAVLALVVWLCGRKLSARLFAVGILPGAVVGGFALIAVENWHWPGPLVGGILTFVLAVTLLAVVRWKGPRGLAAFGLGFILGSHLAAACYNHDVIHSHDGQAMFWAMHVMGLWAVIGAPVLVMMILIGLLDGRRVQSQPEGAGATR